MPDITVPAPSAGYRGDALSPEVFLGLSRNFSLERDMPVGRKGYSVRRNSATAAVFLERIPVDGGDGSFMGAFLLGNSIYKDGGTPTLVDTITTGAYSSGPPPQWAYAYGRAVLVDGTSFRVLIKDGSTLLSRSPLPDPGAPVLAPVAGGSLSQTNPPWYVRIRWYDSKTGTFSGPSQRLATAASITLSGGNNSIQVTRPSAPARADFWQVQLVKTTDTPSGYEISYDVGIGGGLIAIATTAVTITVAPASGTRFEFRADAASILYRHSNPPAAHFVAFWKGRWFYASAVARWLVWTDVGSPEAFYHDTANPEAGFNTALGDGVGNSISGPCTGLFSNQSVLYYATLGEINTAEGTWEEVFDNQGVYVGRRARITPLTQNGLGAVSASFVAVDQEVYFLSSRGPAVISSGFAGPLETLAVRNIWETRSRQYDNRGRIGYDPESDTVLFSVLTQQSPLAGYPDLVLPWQRSRKTWCPPWTLFTTGMTLARFQTDAGVERGLRLILGSWYGQQLEFGIGHGDGWDGSDGDAAERLPSSVTTNSVTFSGETWASNEHAGKSLVLVSPEGNWTVRQVANNTATTLGFDGAVTGLATTWSTYLGGIPYIWHFAQVAPGEMVVRKVAIPLDDQPSRRA